MLHGFKIYNFFENFLLFWYLILVIGPCESSLWMPAYDKLFNVISECVKSLHSSQCLNILACNKKAWPLLHRVARCLLLVSTTSLLLEHIFCWRVNAEHRWCELGSSIVYLFCLFMHWNFKYLSSISLILWKLIKNEDHLVMKFFLKSPCVM